MKSLKMSDNKSSSKKQNKKIVDKLEKKIVEEQDRTKNYRDLKTNTFIKYYIATKFIYSGVDKLYKDKELKTLLSTYNNIEDITTKEIINVIYKTLRFGKLLKEDTTEQILQAFAFTNKLYPEEIDFLGEELARNIKMQPERTSKDITIAKSRDALVEIIYKYIYSIKSEEFSSILITYNHSPKTPKDLENYRKRIDNLLELFFKAFVPNSKKHINKDGEMLLASLENEMSLLNFYIHPQDDLDEVKNFVRERFHNPTLNPYFRFVNDAFTYQQMQPLLNMVDTVQDIVFNEDEKTLNSRLHFMVQLEINRRKSRYPSIKEMIETRVQLGEPIINSSNIVIGKADGDVKIIYNVTNENGDIQPIIETSLENLDSILKLRNIDQKEDGFLYSYNTKIWDKVIGNSVVPKDKNYNNLRKYNR